MDTENLLNKLQIPFRRIDHPPVFTVDDLNDHLIDHFPIKNLFLKDDTKQYYLIIMSGMKRLDLKELAVKINSKKLRFASADNMMELLGVTPGSVSLFGIMNDKNNKVKVFIESSITKQDEISFHPNENTATVFFDPKFLDTIAKELYHEVTVIDI